MGSSASNLCQPKFRILDDAQIGRIHDAVLRILDEVGVRINIILEKAREILDTHQPEPLAAEIKNELDRIWESATKKQRR